MDLLSLNSRIFTKWASTKKTRLYCIVDFIDQRTLCTSLSAKHGTLTCTVQNFKLLASVCIALQADTCMRFCNALLYVHSSFAIILKR